MGVASQLLSLEEQFPFIWEERKSSFLRVQGLVEETKPSLGQPQPEGGDTLSGPGKPLSGWWHWWWEGCSAPVLEDTSNKNTRARAVNSVSHPLLLLTGVWEGFLKEVDFAWREHQREGAAGGLGHTGKEQVAIFCPAPGELAWSLHTCVST